ncbi:endonuclease/exonuclease/phosphatase family protein [Candidatus Woesearchaeota archaeon]|nr:endonuclease/exonuclease/phosphatase family protein [Candidatus Woesearchaeota archaeon]
MNKLILVVVMILLIGNVVVAETIGDFRDVIREKALNECYGMSYVTISDANISLAREIVEEKAIKNYIGICQNQFVGAINPKNVRVVFNVFNGEYNSNAELIANGNNLIALAYCENLNSCVDASVSEEVPPVPDVKIPNLDSEDVYPKQSNEKIIQPNVEENVQQVYKTIDICNGVGRYEGYECRSGAGITNQDYLDKVRKDEIFSDRECENRKCCKISGHYCFKKSGGIAFPKKLGEIPGAEELIKQLQGLKDKQTELTYPDLTQRAGGQEEMGEAWLQQGDIFRELAEMDREYQGEVNLRKKTIIKRIVTLPSKEKAVDGEDSSDEPIPEEVPAEVDEIIVGKPSIELHNSGVCSGFPINFENYVSNNQRVVCLKPCCVMPQLKKKLEDTDASQVLSTANNQIVIHSSGRTTASQRNSYLDYLGGGETACGPKILTADEKKRITELKKSLTEDQKNKLKANDGSDLGSIFGDAIANKINTFENYNLCLHASGTAIDVLWKSIWEENEKNIPKARSLMDQNIPEQNRLRRFLCDQGLINWVGEYWHYDYTGEGWKEGKGKKLCYYGKGNNNKFNFGVPSIESQNEWINGVGYNIKESGNLVENKDWRITEWEKFGEVSKFKCNECGETGECTVEICEALSKKVGGLGCEWKARTILSDDGTCSHKKSEKEVQPKKETVKLVCPGISEDYNGGTLKKNKYFSLIEGKIMPDDFDPDESKKDGDYFKFDDIGSSKVEFDHFIILNGKLVKKDGLSYKPADGFLNIFLGKHNMDVDYKYGSGKEINVDFNEGAYAKYKFKINCNKETDSCEFNSLVNGIKNIEGYNSDCGFTFEADDLLGDEDEEEEFDDNNVVRVMSYNVRKGCGSERFENFEEFRMCDKKTEEIANFISSKNPDILLLQEVDQNFVGTFSPFFKEVSSIYENGLAIFVFGSGANVEESSIAEYQTNENNQEIRYNLKSIVTVKDKTYVVYNTHLSRPRFVNSGNLCQSQTGQTKKYGSTLEQLRQLKEILNDNDSENIIVGGDFNLGSEEIKEIKGFNLVKTEGYTFPTEEYCDYRNYYGKFDAKEKIDHIYYKDGDAIGAGVYEYTNEEGVGKLSDHYPVMVGLNYE